MTRYVLPEVIENEPMTRLRMLSLHLPQPNRMGALTVNPPEMLVLGRCRTVGASPP